MPGGVDVFLVILLIAYLGALGWYVRSVLVARQLEASKGLTPKTPSSPPSSPSPSPEPSSEGKVKKRRRVGKKCPGCGKVIDRRRTKCHHCGTTFELAADAERHPDELQAERAKAAEEKSEE